MTAAAKISSSGLAAASRMVEVAASNIANMRNVGRLRDAEVAPSSRPAPPRPVASSDEPPLYHPLETTLEHVAGGGVRARLREADPPHVEGFEPGHPLADEDGRVARPNVDLADQLLKLRQASRAYQANLAVLRTEDRMIGALLDRET